MRRLAPIKLIPHPPAFELSKKTNSLLSGSLNRDTILDRLLTFIVPSNRTQPYLGCQHPKCSVRWGRQIREGTYFLLRQSFSIRSSVWVALLIKTILSSVNRLIWSSILPPGSVDTRHEKSGNHAPLQNNKLPRVRTINRSITSFTLIIIRQDILTPR